MRATTIKIGWEGEGKQKELSSFGNYRLCGAGSLPASVPFSSGQVSFFMKAPGSLTRSSKVYYLHVTAADDQGTMLQWQLAKHYPAGMTTRDIYTPIAETTVPKWDLPVFTTGDGVFCEV